MQKYCISAISEIDNWKRGHGNKSFDSKKECQYFIDNKLNKKSHKQAYPVKFKEGSPSFIGAKKPSSKFKPSDFTISPLWATGDNRIAYIFESPTSVFNFFWIIGKEPEIRGLVGDSKEFYMKFPLTVKQGQKVPKSKDVL